MHGTRSQSRSADSANSTVFSRFVDALNRQDIDALDDLMQPDFVRHCQATLPLEIKSLDAFKAFQRESLVTFPDASLDVDFVVAEGDKIAASVTLSGTQSGAMGPFPATGRQIRIPFLTILRISGGKIAEMWVEWDNLNMLRALGHVPPG